MRRVLALLAGGLAAALAAAAPPLPPGPPKSPRARLAEDAPWDAAFVEELLRRPARRGDVLRDPSAEYLLPLPPGLGPARPLGGLPAGRHGFVLDGPGGERLVVAAAGPGDQLAVQKLVEAQRPPACPGDGEADADGGPVRLVHATAGQWLVRSAARCAGAAQLAGSLALLDPAASARRMVVAWDRPVARGGEDAVADLLRGLRPLGSGDAAADRLLEAAVRAVAADPRAPAAAEGLRAALARHTDWPRALGLRAYVEARRGDLDRAAATARRALGAEPADPALQRLAVEIALRSWDAAVLRDLGPGVRAAYGDDPVLGRRLDLVADVTGDGLPDRLRVVPGAPKQRLVQYDGLSAQPVWSTLCHDGPAPAVDALGRPEGALLTDLDADGLPDVVLASRGCGAALLALERRSGRELWRAPLGLGFVTVQGLVPWGSLLLLAEGNPKLLGHEEKQAGGALLAFDARTGAVAWRIPWPVRALAGPVQVGRAAGSGEPYVVELDGSGSRPLGRSALVLPLDGRAVLARGAELAALGPDGAIAWSVPHGLPQSGLLALVPFDGAVLVVGEVPADPKGPPERREPALRLARLAPADGATLWAIDVPGPRPARLRIGLAGGEVRVDLLARGGAARSLRLDASTGVALPGHE